VQATIRRANALAKNDRALSGASCDGNHPANYKGCTVYKDLQNKIYQPLQQKHYTPPAQLQPTLHTQPGVAYAQIIEHNISTPSFPEQDPRITQLLQQPTDIQDLKHLMKTLFEQLGTMLNLLTTMLAKLP
jgi:hypothetical protein